MLLKKVMALFRSSPSRSTKLPSRTLLGAFIWRPAQMEAGAERHEASREVRAPPSPPTRAAAYNGRPLHVPYPSPPSFVSLTTTYMEAKKKSPPTPAAAGTAPAAANGYFSSVFSASPTVLPLHPCLYDLFVVRF